MGDIVRSPATERAEATKFLAEAEAAKSKARREGIDADIKGLELEAHTIELDRVREARARELSADFYSRIYRFNSAVADPSVERCIGTLTMWDRLDGENKRPIEVQFFSPGGDVISGMALFDFLQEIRREGHHLTTSSLGYAASMAGILLQAGDHRIMSRESWLLIHQGSFQAMGDYSAVKDRVKWVDKIMERILDIYADRAVPPAAKGREKAVLTKRKLIAKNWNRTDWWLSSDNALELGFCDEVR